MPGAHAAWCGCSWIRPPTIHTGHDVEDALSPKSRSAPLSASQVQAIVMNFADLYVTSVWQTLDEIKNATADPKMRMNLQSMKVYTNTNAMIIAAGRNSAVNLLDMVVFVSLGRYAAENYYVPKMLGSQGEPLVKTLRKLEKEIWQISSRVLSPDQQETLRGLIDEWIAVNPERFYTGAIHLSDFAEIEGISRASQMQAGTLLADVGKVVAVAEEGLLVSERVMFYVERLPRITTMQTELLLDQIAGAPDAAQLRSNLDQLAAAAERMSLVLTDLPANAREERQATINHLFDRIGAERQKVLSDLSSQESRLRGVFEEVRALLDRATPLTDKLNTTVNSADALYRLVDATPSNLPVYNDLLEKSSVVMDKVIHILAEVTPLYSAAVPDPNALNGPLSGKTQSFFDYLFWRALLLIAFFLVGLLGVLLAYRRLSLRMSDRRMR